MSTAPGPCVLGIDSALVRTGLAAIELTPRGCRARTGLVASPAPDHPDISLAGRYGRMERVALGIRAWIGNRAALALIEAPALDADGGDAHTRAWIWWQIIGRLVELGIPVAQVVPGTLKKWATKTAKSEKADVVRAMHQLWPGVPCTTNEARHHECEALGMATMCAQRLGWPVPVRKHHGESLAVVKWPKV